MKTILLLFLIFIGVSLNAQTVFKIKGTIKSENQIIEQAIIRINDSNLKTKSDKTGYFVLENVSNGTYILHIEAKGYQPLKKTIVVQNQDVTIDIDLKNNENQLNEVVISGTLKAVKRLDSPVPVEVYSPVFFKKNPTASIYDALQNVNGVRPQLNCGVCNTGDIHMNGLEGGYTLILIDGMPIVSSLSTVYGLSGIPNSLVERIEIVKGPASSLYGSEAIGGLINIITKNPINASRFSFDSFSTSLLETNVDIGYKAQLGKKATILFGLNYFKFGEKIDKDQDGFTDVTLSDRTSFFQKWTLHRKSNKLFSTAIRAVYEDRFGGDMRWEKQFRGGDSIYGESIYTKRVEIISAYELPTKEKLMFTFSGNAHFQDSRYGKTNFIANQKIAFAQLTWGKKIAHDDFLAGIATRFNYYEDNTLITQNINKNKAQMTWLPGIFVQDEITINKKHKMLFGFRYDYNTLHGSILTPRFAYQWKINGTNSIRLNGGSGFRVVNLFTEDHAALTGAREIVIRNDLRPEKSINVNLNYVTKFNFESGLFIGVETSAFHTRFFNKIISNYDLDPNKIFYDNIDGYAINQGFTSNVDINFPFGLKVIMGGSIFDNKNYRNGIAETLILTERYTGTWSISYTIKPLHLSIDYTGNLYGRMRLPLLSPTDPRSPSSPVYSIQNIQFTYLGTQKFEFYAGIKNLLNFTPQQHNPFLISRTQDPFDKKVQFDANGKVIPTPDNPYGLTFDTSYVYAQNQGIKAFLGFRYNIK